MSENNLKLFQDVRMQEKQLFAHIMMSNTKTICTDPILAKNIQKTMRNIISIIDRPG